MIKRFSTSKAFPGILMALSVVAAILHRACRQNWVYTTAAVGFDLPLLLLMLMIAASVIFGTLFILKLNSNDFCNKKAYKTLLGVGGFFAIILFLYAFIYSVGYAPGEAWEVFRLYFGKTLSEGALLILVPFFVLFYPRFSCKVKKIIAVIFVVSVTFFAVNAFYPLSGYKITADPMVIDNGSEYSVVFSTNDEGNAYIEYTYEGEDYKIFDNVGGKLVRGRIHSIPVPYEHLRNNKYKVSSTRVIEEFSYGSRRGKTVTSSEYEFIYNDTDNQNWLVISDWHTKIGKANKAIENLGAEYDGVMLLGDATPGVDFEQQVITTIVEFGGNVSGGTKPVLYVRGNHETRGAYADDLPVALGIEQFYYTSDIGPYSFVILDSGEDKEDSHIEYGGMTDYGTYRADMIEWIKDVKVKNKKVISLSHAWQVSEVEAELSAEAWAELDRLGTRLMLSGHIHQCALVDEFEHEYEGKQVKEKYPDIVAYIDGGKTGDGYVASLLTLKESGFNIKAVSDSGGEILNRQFEW